MTENQSRHEEFVSLYVRNEAAIFSFVLSLVKHNADAEDVVQRASVTMWRRFESFELGTNFRAWAFQISKNEALNLLSKNKRDRHVFSEKLIAMLADEAEERADDLDSRQRALDFCVEKLPPDELEIVKGCYREGATIRSFSEQAGETANKIYKKLNRVRRDLQRCVEAQVGQEKMRQ